LEASGNLNINVFNFFSVSGGFAFVKRTDTVTLNDGDVASGKPASQVDVDLLTVGGSGERVCGDERWYGGCVGFVVE
jgi:hypothetical protein